MSMWTAASDLDYLGDDGYDPEEWAEPLHPDCIGATPRKPVAVEAGNTDEAMEVGS